MKAQWEAGHLQVKSEATEEISLADPLIMGFWPLGLWENKFLLSHPVCGILLWQPEQTNTAVYVKLNSIQF